MPLNRPLVDRYLQIHEPEQVAMRRRGTFKRRRAWAAGVNDCWAFDQHDKWMRFHLYMHGGLDICAGYQLWLKIWRSASDPRLICSYYLQAARKIGGEVSYYSVSYCFIN